MLRLSLHFFAALLLIGTGLSLLAGQTACGGPAGQKPPPHGRGKSPGDARARAVALLREGEPRQALELLQQHVAPDDPDGAFLMGEAALRSGRYAQAERAYRQVVRMRPDDLPASTRLARIAFLEARYDDARKQLDWVLARSPDLTEARSLRTRIRLRQGDLNGAAADARRWAERAPRDAEPLRILGVVQRHRGDAPGAVEVLKRAVALDPSHVPSRLELARAYADAGRNELSQRTLRDASRLERQQREAARRRADATYHRLRALKFLEEGRPDAALKNFEDALQMDPENPALLREAGEAALTAGDTPRALSYLERAVGLAPSDAPILRVRGEVLTASGEPGRALQDLLEAVRLDPTDPAAHRALARAYRALNRPEWEHEAALADELEKRITPPPLPEVLP